MADAKHIPAGPPAAGEHVNTPAVRGVVIGIKAQNQVTRDQRRAERQARRSGQ